MLGYLTRHLWQVTYFAWPSYDFHSDGNMQLKNTSPQSEIEIFFPWLHVPNACYMPRYSMYIAARRLSPGYT